MKKILGYGAIVVGAVVVLAALLYFLFPETVFKLALDALRRSAGLVRKEVRVDNHRIVYLEGGKGETVVLLHGFGANKDSWTAFARYLKGYHLVIPDVPGFGESSRVPADRYDVGNQARRIARFVDVLQLDRFHLAGNSLGGALSATYAANNPERVLTLGLLDTAGTESPHKSGLVMELEKGRNPMLGRSPEDFDKLMAMTFVKMPPIPEPFKKIIAADWGAHAVFNRKIWDDWRPQEFTLAPVLPLIQTPVLIIWGDKDQLTDIGGVSFLEKHLKNHRTVILKDTGHFPMLEKPEETAKAYLSFLKEKR